MQQLPENLGEMWNSYQLKIKAQHSDKQAKRIINETQSALFRLLIFPLNEKLQSTSRKMTVAETNAAKSFLYTVDIRILVDASTLVQQGLAKLESSSSRNTYGNRMEQLLAWCKGCSWWVFITSPITIPQIVSSGNECCPRVHKGFGKALQQHLTSRRSVYPTFKLQEQDIYPELRSHLEELQQYWTDPDRHDRFEPCISESSAQIHLKEILKMLGWFKEQGTPLEELRLDLLVPKLTNDELEDLSLEEQDQLWHDTKNYFDRWLSEYFNFCRDIVGAKSPRTQKFRLQALIALCKFQYRTEIGSAAEHRKLPMFKAINEHSNRIRKRIRQWDRNKQRVVPIAEKWPDVVEGQTALVTVRKQVTERLRNLCKPLGFTKRPRTSSAIGTSLRDYLGWDFCTDLPTRRQEEFCSLKVSLNCPIERPKDLPTNGLYHPLPSNHERYRKKNDTVWDNFIYKTYTHHGRGYPEGIWVLDIRKFKTQNRYHAQQIVIKNRQFADGSTLYDYIERYLYGWWEPSNYQGYSTNGYGEYEFSGQPREWLSLGRLQFSPRDEFKLVEDEPTRYIWGYFFVKPRRGTPYNDKEFSQFFSTAAYKVIKKRINPHLLRNMWAAWAFQVGLTDHQRESLAYAMGMDVTTLRDTYEMCSPDEKRRPIEDVIDQVFFNDLEAEYQESSLFLEQIADELLTLSDDCLQYYEQQFLAD